MMRSTSMLASCAALLALLGCTQYHYHARTVLPDAQGHEALASWSVTERALWFDESSETIRVTMQCGKTVAFQQRHGGVYMLHDPTQWSDARNIDGTDYCGQVLGVTKLSEIAVGSELHLALWCIHQEDDEGFSIPAPILPTGDHAFGAVQRSKEEPRVAPCEP